MESALANISVKLGMVSMFTLACPLAPILCLLSVQSFISDKRLNLYRSARPMPSAQSGIDQWLTFFEVKFIVYNHIPSLTL